MNIKSSRAFDQQEHNYLYDIIDKLDKIAENKKKRDL